MSSEVGYMQLLSLPIHTLPLTPGPHQHPHPKNVAFLPMATFLAKRHFSSGIPMPQTPLLGAMVSDPALQSMD